MSFSAGEILTAAKLNALITTDSWTSFTPAFTANFTVGNATTACSYFRAGRLIVVKIDITFGSTTAVTGALPTGTLPVTAEANTFGGGQVATFRDVSATTDYDGFLRLAGTTSYYIEAKNVAGANDTRTGIAATVPFTWATGDIIEGYLMYQAAS